MKLPVSWRSYLLPLIACTLFSPASLLSADNNSANTDGPCKNFDKDHKITFDWSAATASGNEIPHAGNYCFVVENLNPLYSYTIANQVGHQTTNALADLNAVILQMQKPLAAPQSNTGSPLNPNFFTEELPKPPCTSNDVAAILKAVTQFTTDAQLLDPAADSKGNYSSETFTQTKTRWQTILKPKLEVDVAAISTSANCSSVYRQNSIDTANKAIDDVDNLMTDAHTVVFILSLNRTEDLVTTVSETYKGQTTRTASYELKPSWTIYTASGGFLLTTLPARTYNSRTVPNPAGTGTQNVLEVDNASGIRPALTALMNFNVTPTFHTCNCGFAASAGIVYDISSGKADTSHFGVFAGPSFHLFDRFIVTAGYHFGEFADFPAGYQNGQVIPPNIGTPTPVNRWSARFGFAFTYQFKSSRQTTNTGQPAKTTTTAAITSGTKPNNSPPSQ